jgi:phospholipid/cholesterol/gamma-HCH transport system substrate-binding protein
MRSTRTIDISTGLFVLLGFAAILFMVTQITNKGYSLKSDSYRLMAAFSMAGVTIGRVEDIQYDMKLYKAVVTMRINDKYRAIPNDSDASIYTAGLLGGQYIGLTPGGSEVPYKDGEQIIMANDAVVLENLISKYLFNSAATKPDASTPAPAPAAQE